MYVITECVLDRRRGMGGLSNTHSVISTAISTASGALVVGGVRDIVVVVVSPEIGLSVQWSTTNQSVAVCGSL